MLDEDEIDDNPLYGFNGIYVRRLTDCAVLERVAYDAPIDTGAPLMATRDAIVVVRRDGVDLIERGTPAPAIQSLTSADRRRYLLEPPTGTIYELGADGALDAVTLHRMQDPLADRTS